MLTVLFYLGFSSLIAHEMDAIAHKEWQLLYLFRKLPENAAFTLFITAHVPLLAASMWLTHHRSILLQASTRSLLMLFLVIHAILHKRLEQHSKYTFHTSLSKSLIYGSGIAGLLYCVLHLIAR